MSPGNKIDFIAKPEKSFLYSNDFMSNHFRQFSIINDIHSELDQNFNGFIVGLITLTYFRLNGIAKKKKLEIPPTASFDNLSYNELTNFFADIFNRYKKICEANKTLESTASILEPYFLAGATKISSCAQERFAIELIAMDWSESGFTNQECGLYVEGDLIRDILVDATTDSVYPDYYLHLHHLAPLLDIRPDEKQLCTPIFYNIYLIHIFEQLGWPKNDSGKFVNKHLKNVTAVQADPILWAIHTLEVFLFGSNQKLSEANDLATISSKAPSRFDAIVLPEVSNNTIPDIGPIAVGNVIIEKACYLNNLYYVAFLYNLLNKNGRMLIRFDNNAETALNSDPDKLLAYFVDNNVIEVVIQTSDCTYMLIDKNRPEVRHGWVLFYYGAYFRKLENVASCLKQFSCADIKIKHDEGACIVSNQEIRLNNYCLLPKKYIFDFDRVKKQVETDMMHRILHEANPRISDIEMSLKYLGKFLNKYGLDEEPYQEKLDEDDNVPSAKDVINGCRADLRKLQEGIAVTERIVLESFDKSNFNPCDLNELFSEISKHRSHKNKKYYIQIDGTVKSSPIIDEIAFRDMIENIIRNAEEHGFKNDRTDNRIIFDLSQKGPRIVIKCLNNGNPLPPNFTKDKLFSKGDKGPNSLGMGLGGERIDKILAVHDADFDVLPIGKLPQGFTVGFEITLPVKRDTNEQR